MSRGPILRAERVEPPELVLGEPDDDARRRGCRSSPAPRRSRARRARTRARPRRPRRAGSRARRASSRARRRRGRRERLAHLLASGHGITASPRASRSSAPPPRGRLDAADEEARRERVARAGRVDDLGRHGRIRARRRRRRRRAPRFTIQRRVELAERVALALDREDDVGRERPGPRAERVVDQRPRREVERDLRAGRARRARPRAAPPPRSAPASARSPTRAEHRSGTTPARAPRGRELGRDAAVGDHRPLARGGDRDDDARPSADRPDHLDAAPAQLARDELAGRVVAALASTRRASAPSDAAHAATFAACPPAVTRVVATRSSSGASGSSRLAITSRSRSPSVVISTVRCSHGRPGPATFVAHRLRSFALGGLVGAAGTIAAARRLGRLAPSARRARGPRRVRGRAVLPRGGRARGAALPRGRRRDGDGPVEARVAVVHEVRGGDHPQRQHAARSSGRSAGGTTPGRSGRRTRPRRAP